MASTHKHIRSGTANKRPTTAIADGQIALNTNLSSPGLFFKDSTGAEILKIGPVHVGATAPNASPAGSAGNSTGEIWLDTSLTPVGVKIWNGSAFVNATPIGSTTVQGLLELATDAETQAGADTARAVTSASLQSKLSDSTSTTSNTTIASSTAVKAAYDLANAALPKTGGTVTGDLEIGTAGSLSFEGATADGFETTIAVVDPTADRTITLPNTTGTVVTTGDSGTVTSTMLLDGTIVDADINASAAIAYSKLASLTSANILVGNSSNVATSTAVTGDVTISNAGVTAISSGAIVNADVNASAAIAGSKISPDFGSQNVVTTGTSTAGSFTPTSTTVPAVGVYSPGANRLGITTNTVERVEFGTSEVVFNDDAADYDFRIEGDTNSNLFFADASAEAVGIRTATPVSELNVSVGNGGNITISNTNDAHSAGLAFGDTTSNSSGRISYDHSTNALAVATNGTEKLIVLSNGNVGIGTSSPRSLFNLAASATSGTILTVENTSTSLVASQYIGRIQFYGNDASSNSSGVRASIDAAAADAGGGTDIVFSNSKFIDSTLYERLRIDQEGRVGIGTTAPVTTLQVDASGGGTIRILRSSFSANYVQLEHDGTNGTITSFGATGNLLFNVNSGERARIDTSGRLLVGTSSSSHGAAGVIINRSSGTSDPSSVLKSGSFSIQSIAAEPALVLSCNINTAGAATASETARGGIGFEYLNGATPTQFVLGTFGTPAVNCPLRIFNASTEGININSNGAVRFANVTTTASSANAFLDSGDSNNLLRSTSSLRYKTNIENIQQERSSAILNLRPVWYRSLASADRKDWSWYGLIAEEVAEVEPRLVHWTYLEDAYEEIGGEKQLKPDAELVPDGVQYDRLTVLLLDVVKKQQQAIETLEQRLTAAGI